MTSSLLEHLTVEPPKRNHCATNLSTKDIPEYCIHYALRISKDNNPFYKEQILHITLL